jgi:hypothetical protein
LVNALTAYFADGIVVGSLKRFVGFDGFLEGTLAHLINLLFREFDVFVLTGFLTIFQKQLLVFSYPFALATGRFAGSMEA